MEEIASEWGRPDPLLYSQHICELLRQYLPNKVAMKSRVLVVNCSMGRVLKDISASLREGQMDVHLQGHIGSIRNYIIADYFLNRVHSPLQIYPHILSFSNRLHQEAPYMGCTVPCCGIDHSYFYYMTMGEFTQLYRHHS